MFEKSRRPDRASAATATKLQFTTRKPGAVNVLRQKESDCGQSQTATIDVMADRKEGKRSNTCDDP